MKSSDKLNKPKLLDALSRVAEKAAQREDVVVELRDTDLTRLEILSRQLEDVRKDAEERAPGFFTLSVAPSTPPRLWIDPVTHVHMSTDRRSYRMVRDTHRGRVILTESASQDTVTDAIADVVAERIIERDKVMAGDALLERLASAETAGDKPEKTAPRSMTSAVAGFFIGGAVTVAALFGWAIFSL